MPELPEVETIRLFLQKHLIGKTIQKIEILTPKSFIGDPKKIIGAKILSFSRLGKQLSIHLSNKLILLIHLKMTGQLIISSTHKPSKSTRVIIKLKSCPSLSKSLDPRRGEGRGVDLHFNDSRKFGWIKIFSPDELVESQKNLGLDIFHSDFTPKYLYRQLHSTSRPIKLTLLDQSKLAGIGNIYANDALFLSKIHPQTPSNTVSRSQALTLHRSLLSIMTQFVTHGGSTAKDNKYLLLDGSKGSHQFHFQVYQRAGEPCHLCHTPIKRLTLGGRGTFFCPQCQKLSK